MSSKLIYKDIAVGSDSDAQVSTSDAKDFSDVSLLPFGGAVPPIITCEHNMVVLDGTYEIHQDQEIPFVSEEMSGDDCSFTSPPQIRINFDEQYTSLGITLDFSPETGDFCTSVTIVWYQNGVQLDSQSFTPTSATYFCANTVVAYDEVLLTFNRTNLPGRYARIGAILFGIVREFQADEMESLKILQGINLISAELPTSTLKWALRSKNDIDFVFQNKQPISVFNNDYLVGVYYITSATRVSARRYDVECEDAIGVLAKSKFPPTIYTNKNAGALISEIVNDNFPVEIDAAIAAKAITGYIPNVSRRDALLLVCFAAGAIAVTAGYAGIRIKTLPTAAKAIPDNRIYAGSNAVKTRDIVTEIRVTAHTYTPGSSGNDVIVVNGINYMHTTSVISVINPNITATDMPNVIEYRDATLVNPGNVAEVAQRAFDYHIRPEYTAKIVLDDESPGDLISAATPFGTVVAGNIEELTLSISNTTAAELSGKVL